jgi:hypothetical protein
MSPDYDIRFLGDFKTTIIIKNNLDDKSVAIHLGLDPDHNREAMIKMAIALVKSS